MRHIMLCTLPSRHQFASKLIWDQEIFGTCSIKIPWSVQILGFPTLKGYPVEYTAMVPLWSHCHGNTSIMTCLQQQVWAVVIQPEHIQTTITYYIVMPLFSSHQGCFHFTQSYFTNLFWYIFLTGLHDY